ncbi:MAG: hypothetical protein HUU22_07575 [Phycisphaerae bacterium]|nr:hypothetical protein [Phycisphaerae bacterium]
MRRGSSLLIEQTRLSSRQSEIGSEAAARAEAMSAAFARNHHNLFHDSALQPLSTIAAVRPGHYYLFSQVKY